METKEAKILEVAEHMVRSGGYNAFSFRDIAEAVGIKSASVHYHFPTKADLGVAVAAYYTDKFLKHVGAPEDLHTAGKDPVKTYIATFKEALQKDKRMCLCGLLGAETKGLPDAVAKETKIFFERNIDWLTRAYTLIGEPNASDKAIHLLALLEGAMIVSIIFDDVNRFDRIVSA